MQPNVMGTGWVLLERNGGGSPNMKKPSTNRQNIEVETAQSTNLHLLCDAHLPNLRLHISTYYYYATAASCKKLARLLSTL
jgi:hypothetical protein